MLYTNLKIMLNQPCRVKIINEQNKQVKLHDIVKDIILKLEVGTYKIKIDGRKTFKIELEENKCEIIV